MVSYVYFSMRHTGALRQLEQRLDLDALLIFDVFVEKIHFDLHHRVL